MTVDWVMWKTGVYSPVHWRLRLGSRCQLGGTRPAGPETAWGIRPGFWWLPEPLAFPGWWEHHSMRCLHLPRASSVFLSRLPSPYEDSSPLAHAHPVWPRLQTQSHSQVPDGCELSGDTFKPIPLHCVHAQEFKKSDASILYWVPVFIRR